MINCIGLHIHLYLTTVLKLDVFKWTDNIDEEPHGIGIHLPFFILSVGVSREEINGKE